MARPKRNDWAYPNSQCAPPGVAGARRHAKTLLGKDLFDRLCELRRDVAKDGALARARRREEAGELRNAISALRDAKNRLESLDVASLVAAGGARGLTISVMAGNTPRVEVHSPIAALPAADCFGPAVRGAVAHVETALEAARALRDAVRSGRGASVPSGHRPERTLNDLARAAAGLPGVTATALAYFAIGDYLETPCGNRVEFERRQDAWKVRLRRARDGFHRNGRSAAGQ
jgi:hypothetical protein